MRSYDEEDPKKPAPVRYRRKGEEDLEARDRRPVGPKDADEEHHAHVRC